MYSPCLSRSKSLGTLSVPPIPKSDRFGDYFNDNQSQSECSAACVIVDSRSNISSVESRGGTYRLDEEGISMLEQKMSKLIDMMQEQYDALLSLKEEVIASKLVLNTISVPSEIPHEAINNENVLNGDDKAMDDDEEGSESNQARNLLDAIEQNQVQRADGMVRDHLTKFLQSEDLKDRIASATAESVKDVICTTFSETFPAVYMPILEHSHRRLLNHVTGTLEKAFNELEAGTGGLFKSVHGHSRYLRQALHKHQILLENETKKSGAIFDNYENTLELILKNELKQWRERVTAILSESPPTNYKEIVDASSVFPVHSPPQPADPERSIIDQLMKSAEIKKQIKEGDINKSFEEALSSSDLSLVMAACKAVEPDKIFGPPCALRQCVLLSLIQQLATDMVHDTGLKCRYLEEAIINLNSNDQRTRAHLPLVVGDVRKHLTQFLRAYPNHVASRRITLIIMAADNLLK